MSHRPETGPMKFGDDWTDLFIRGDNAMYFAYELQHYLEQHKPPDPDLTTLVVQEVVELLSSCTEAVSVEAQARVQRLIDYDKCVEPTPDDVDPMDPRYTQTPDDVLQDLRRVQTELATLMGLTGDVQAQILRWVLKNPGAEERSPLIRSWLQLYDLHKALLEREEKAQAT